MGRTARAGRDGTSITFVGESSQERAIVKSAIVNGKGVAKTVDWKQAEETNKLLESKESVIDEVLEEEKEQRSCFVPKWNSPRHPTLSNTNKKYIHVQKNLV